MRLGVYADLVYRRDGDVLSTDRAFILFVTALQERVDELVLFGRLAPEPGRAEYVLPEGVRLVPLPYYRSVKDIGAVVRSFRGSLRAFARELPALDAVWLFGPYPLSMLFAVAALRRRTRVFLGVRQDFPQYVRNRLPGPAWRWAVGVAVAFEHAWRLLARRAPAVVVGQALGDVYPKGTLVANFSLIRDADVVDADAAAAREWNGEILTVGRIDTEKNPLLLADVLAQLRERDERWRLRVVGRGPLEHALRDRASELGVDDALEIVGYVANGDALWQLYRAASVFLHVSWTEGVPQVLFEAQAAGTPIVATDVGGVSSVVSELLIPPGDAAAAVAALERVRDDAGLRERLARAGVERAGRETADAQLDRIARFFDSSST